MDITEQLHYVTDQIKSIRLKKGISQVELSLRSDLSQSFLANLEKGKKQPSVLTIMRIAEALNVDVQEFFPEKIQPESRDCLKSRIISLLDRL